MEKLTLHVDGMMCEGCENRIKKSLYNMAGVTEVEASHKKGTVTVIGDSIDKETVIGRIKELDFKVKKN